MSFFYRNSGEQNSKARSWIKPGITLMLATMLAGCSEKTETPSNAQVPTGPQVSGETAAKSIVDDISPAGPTQPTVSTTQPQAVAQEAPANAATYDSNATISQEEAQQWLAELNLMVNEYKGTYGTLPPDLDEFIRRGVFKTPPPAPAGKKYVLDPESKKVVLKDK
jgi:hypothetical protein